MAFKRFLVLLSTFVTAIALTTQLSNGIYQHYLDANGTEVVVKVADISGLPPPPAARMHRRQSVTWPAGTNPTCADSSFLASDLYDVVWGEYWNYCPSYVGIIYRGFTVTYNSVTGYFCSYEQLFENVKCVQDEWGTAVGQIAATCTGEESPDMQSGKEQSARTSRSYDVF